MAQNNQGGETQRDGRAIYSTIRTVVDGILAMIKQSVKGTTDAANTVKRTVRTTTGAVKKALAGFDELNRLDLGGAISVSVTTTTSGSLAQGEKEVQTFASVIRRILEGIRNAFSTNMEEMETGLQTYIGEILSKTQNMSLNVGEILRLLLNGVVKPFTLGMGLGLDSLWGSLKDGLNNFIQNWIPGFKGAMDSVTGFFRSESAGISGTMSETQQTMTGLLQFLSGTFSGSWKSACDVLGSTWSSVWSALPGTCKPGLNETVGMVNSVMTNIVNGLNGLIKKANGISFTLPNWSIFGSSAGKKWSPSLATLQLPFKVPLLAQGAVLPANRPFLAMVGDQKHGTNVEAPLSTIQEAVSLSMQDFVESNLAGHEATAAVLREILEAVLGISIGDDVIAGAVSRYQRKMAVVRGGVL